MFKVKKVLCNIMVFVFSILLFACSSSENSNNDVVSQIQNVKTVNDYSNDATIDDFDTVKFGKYPKSDVSGKKKEDIEWIVLKKDDKEAILISKYILEHKQFEESGSDFKWDDSSLKKWLNDEFYKTAFNNTNLIKNNEIKILEDGIIESAKIGCLKTTNTNYAKRYYDKVDESDFTWYREIDNFTGNNNIDLSYYKVIVGAEKDNRPQEYNIKYNFPVNSGDGNSGYINSDNPKYDRYNVKFLKEKEINIVWGLRNGEPGAYYYLDAIGVLGISKGYINDGRTNTSNLHFYGVRPLITIDLSKKDNKNTSKKNVKKITKEYDVKEIIRNIITVDRFSDNASVETFRTVKFGKYKNNGKNEDLKWIVLDRDDNKALLLSQYAIKEMVYNDEIENISELSERNIIDWERSQVRSYLNNDFYNTTFNDEEKKMIINSYLENAGELFVLNEGLGRYLYNSKYSTNGTQDKIFVLSKDEIIKYFYNGIYDNDVSNRLPKKLGTKLISGNSKQDGNNFHYWTRTETIFSKYYQLMGKQYSSDERKVYAVNSNQMASYIYQEWPNMEYAVRPAMWVEWNDVYKYNVGNDLNFYINGILQRNTWVDYLDNRYYVDENGFPVKNQFVDGSYLGNDGRMVRNKKMDDGTYVDFYGKTINIKEDLDKMIKNENIEVNTWHRTEGGLWYYFENDRSNPKKGWYKEEKDNQMYYLDEETGIMATGWTQINGAWYYFNEQHAIVPNWYYIEASDIWDSYGNDIKAYGSMFRDEFTPDGKRVDASGKLIE